MTDDVRTEVHLHPPGAFSMSGCMGTASSQKLAKFTVKLSGMNMVGQGLDFLFTCK